MRVVSQLKSAPLLGETERLRQRHRVVFGQDLDVRDDGFGRSGRFTARRSANATTRSRRSLRQASRRARFDLRDDGHAQGPSLRAALSRPAESARRRVGPLGSARWRFALVVGLADQQQRELPGTAQLCFDGRRLSLLTAQVTFEIRKRLLDELAERHAGSVLIRDGQVVVAPEPLRDGECPNTMASRSEGMTRFSVRALGCVRRNVRDAGCVREGRTGTYAAMCGHYHGRVAGEQGRRWTSRRARTGCAPTERGLAGY